MQRSSFLVFLFLLFIQLAFLPPGLCFTPSSLHSSLSYAALKASSCNGPLGRCSPDDEFLMDSEINRRILAGTSGYISYGALSANRVPCNTAGRSYYNCRGSGPANPYTRGCSKITKCQRDTS